MSQRVARILREDNLLCLRRKKFAVFIINREQMRTTPIGFEYGSRWQRRFDELNWAETDVDSAGELVTEERRVTSDQAISADVRLLPWHGPRRGSRVTSNSFKSAKYWLDTNVQLIGHVRTQEKDREENILAIICRTLAQGDSSYSNVVCAWLLCLRHMPAKPQ